VVLDELVETRLGDRRVIDFAMAVAAEADQVNDDVAVELVAIFGGDPGYADDGVDVFGVDVEYGDSLALGEVGGEAGRVLIAGSGGEAD